MECKEFTVVSGWAVVCPHCESASGQQPTNAGYYMCPECRQWSYNKTYNKYA